MDLRQQTARGGIVMAAAIASIHPIKMVALILLARLLEPRDFGLVALAMLLFSTADLFSGLGMEAALIHSQSDRRLIAFQAFVMTVFTSSTLFLLVNANASFFAALLGNVEVVPVIHVLSLLVFFDALALVPTALLRKDLRFGRVSTAMLISELSYTGIALGLAVSGFGVWSLACAELARSLARLVTIWLACPGWDWLMPKPWDGSTMKALLRYGLQSTGSGFLSFFNSNWDDWLVGRFLGPTPLGFYTKAYSLTNTTIAGINRTVINGILFPAYAQIQDEKERLSRFYVKSLSLVALVMAPLAMGVFIVAPEVIPLLLGEKWVPMVPTLQIFAFMALVRPLSGSTSPLFQAVGRPDFDLRAGLVLTAVMAPLAIGLLNGGIAGVALGVTAAHLAGFLYNIYQVHAILPGTASKMLPAIRPALLASAVMMVGVQLAKLPLYRLAGDRYDVISIGALILIGAVLYVLTAFLVQRALILETLKLARAVFKDRHRIALGRR